MTDLEPLVQKWWNAISAYRLLSDYEESPHDAVLDAEDALGTALFALPEIKGHVGLESTLLMNRPIRFLVWNGRTISVEANRHTTGYSVNAWPVYFSHAGGSHAV